MSFYDLMGMSLGNLWRRKLRTVLTVLGVLIGTTSIVAMLSLALGMKSMLMEEFSGMGSITQIRVTSDQEMGSGNVDVTTLLSESNQEIFEEMEYVESVTPQLSFEGNIKQGKYNGYGSILGVDRSVLKEQELEKGELPEDAGNTLQLLAGNMILTSFGYMQGEEYIDYYSTGELPDIDLMQQIKQISVYNDSAYSEDSGNTSDSTEEDDFSDDSFEDDLDQSVSGAMDDSMGMLQFRVNVSGIMAGGTDTYKAYSYYLLADVDALKKYLVKNYGKGNIPGQPKPNGRPLNEWIYNTFIVNVDDAEHVDSVMQDIQDMGFRAESNKDLLESTQKSLRIVELVLGGIGMVAFLVAAIGIANTMMMSTYERTKEIGIMKVLGCDMRDIQKLFLMEAGFIGLLGGVFGLGLTVIVSLVINHIVQSMGEMIGKISVIPWWLAIVAVAFSTLMGMIAGFFPARRAMKLSPLAAIHTE